MAFLTESRARSALRIQGREFAESQLRKSAAAPLSDQFDIFLSHSFLDAEVIEGVKELLEAEGLRVYVDWIDDPQLDRAHVTARTADALRTRMRNSKSMVFATSNTSSGSKWMPWELGYFDGYRPDHVAILPLVKIAGSGFQGQEYIGLYPYVEDINFAQGARGLGIYTSDRRAARRISQFPIVGAKRQG